MDDEYATAGVKDPKILLTTARDPSSRLAQFAKVCLEHLVAVATLCGFDPVQSASPGADCVQCLHSVLTSLQEMRLVFPNATRINRGSTVMREMAEACRANDYTDLIVLHEHRGQPGEYCCHQGTLLVIM